MHHPHSREQVHGQRPAAIRLPAVGAHHWAIVLAAGRGSRLAGLSTDAAGRVVPKQFCTLEGGATLLERTIARARTIAAPTRIVTVVAAEHREWWTRGASSTAGMLLVEQPDNRGTANGILLPLLHVMERDPAARVLLLPSDHHVGDEPVLADALHAALRHVGRQADDVLLLGIGPDHADPELGWIVPRAPRSTAAGDVARFVEKPDAALARELMRQGALWNSFIIAARARALLELFEDRLGGIVADMRAALGSARALDALYARLPSLDFSRDVLEGRERSLRVLHVPACGWSDLGTPRRIADLLPHLPERRPAAHAAVPRVPCLADAAELALRQLAG